MDYRTVYRIEGSRIREGPFVNSWAFKDDKIREVLEAISVQDAKLPQPFVDFKINSKLGIPYCMKFGCSSIEQLSLWFVEPVNTMDPRSFLEGMSKEGFVLAVYKVPRKILQEGRSGKQVMYPYTEATLVKDMSLTELLKGNENETFQIDRRTDLLNT